LQVSQCQSNGNYGQYVQSQADGRYNATFLLPRFRQWSSVRVTASLCLTQARWRMALLPTKQSIEGASLSFNTLTYFIVLVVDGLPPTLMDETC
jgi:hypothetical protein